MKSTDQGPIRLLLLDSHMLFREGLKRLLETDRNLKVVAEGEQGQELLSLYADNRPDVVLMELQLPDGPGLQACRELLDQFPHANVLVFTGTADPNDVAAALEAGVAGYLLKEMEGPDIIDALKAVSTGGFFLHPRVAKEFIGDYNRLAHREKKGIFMQGGVVRPYHLLTRREVEVLQLMSEGHSNRSLGEVMGVSEKTIKNHVSAILRKMGLHDRTQAVVTAIKHGWVELR